MKRLILKKQGSAKNLNLQIEKLKIKLGKDDVVVRQKAIGINFFDIHFRNGFYGLERLPSVLGLEACGHVEAVGKNVIGIKPGDRVAYATAPLGSYTDIRVLHQRFLVLPPKELTDIEVAGSLLKGLMSHTLLFRVYMASNAKRILVHSAAGGVGHILANWAHNLGIKVIGSVGDDSKIAFARDHGCSHVVNYKDNNFLKKIEEITNGEGVGVVYDGVGNDVMENSLKSLHSFGIYVNYGQVSGNCKPLDLRDIMLRSLYVSTPFLATYKAMRPELVLSSLEVFDKLKKKIIKPKIKVYNGLESIVSAHQDLESGKTTGSLVIKL